VRFLRFSRKRQDGSALNFYQDLEKYIHLIITTCIEKQCTRPLKCVLKSDIGLIFRIVLVWICLICVFFSQFYVCIYYSDFRCSSILFFDFFPLLLSLRDQCAK